MTKLMALTEAIDVLESVLDDVEGDNRRDVARRAWISVKETLSAYADDRDALGLSKVRTIFDTRLWQDGHRLLFRVRGSGFLKHMVRNMVGTLLEAGKGNLDREGLARRLEPGYQGKSGPRAPACGLFLMSVEYP